MNPKGKRAVNVLNVNKRVVFQTKIGPEDKFFDAFCVYFEQEYMNIVIKPIIQSELLQGKL